MNKCRSFLPNTKKLICFLTGLLLLAILLPFNAAANDSAEVLVTTEQQLREAVRYDGNVITISGDFYITYEPVLIDREITLRGHGVLAVTGRHEHFTVEEGGVLILDGDITLTRVEGPTSGGVRVYNSSFIMHDGQIYRVELAVVLVDNSNFYMYGGEIKNNRHSGVHLNHSTFHMYDGVISGNSAHNGGGVGLHRNSVFNMHGGEISNNSATEHRIDGGGGGVFVSGGSVFNMYGGEILGNTSEHNGGGVSVSERSEFFMHGGVISDNSARVGGGVFIAWCQWLRASLFVFIDGSITNNAAQYQGGGIVSRSHLVVHGGEITNNEADRGGGIYIDMLAAYAVIQGSKISDNTAHRYGGGIYNERGAILSIIDSEIIGNTAIEGGGIYTQNYHNLRIREDVVFRDNASSNAHNFGMWAGSERFPLITWSGENSIPNTHLKNNHDISYMGRWTPSIWVVCFIIALSIIAIKLAVTRYCLKKKQKTELEQIVAGDVL